MRLCPLCAKPLGAGVTRCWNNGCNYILPDTKPKQQIPILKLIGYWRDPDDASEMHYPDPDDLIDFGWLPEERHELASYLRPEQFMFGQWGYSWCRFHCGVTHTEMGSREFTDGVWMWPEGLAHYVEHHGVMLPDAFVEHARSNSWVVPEINSSWATRRKDSTFWLEWASHTKRQNKMLR